MKMAVFLLILHTVMFTLMVATFAHDPSIIGFAWAAACLPVLWFAVKFLVEEVEKAGAA